MGHFLRLLVTRRWGWTLIAAAIIAGGILWGVSSPLIPYEISKSSTGNEIIYASSVANNGNIYIWTTTTTPPTFYVARRNDFNPPINPAVLVNFKGYVRFIDRTDTINVDEQLTNNVHVTQAHIIEQLALYDVNRQPTGSFNASDYTPGSSGYFENRWWPGGSATIAVGLLIAAIALFARRRKRGGKAPDQSDPNWPYASIAPYPTTEPGTKP